MLGEEQLMDASVFNVVGAMAEFERAQSGARKGRPPQLPVGKVRASADQKSLRMATRSLGHGEQAVLGARSADKPAFLKGRH